MVGKDIEKVDKKVDKIEREKVFICADSPFTKTAYAKVASKMAEWLKEKYDVYYISLQPMGISFNMYGITIVSGTESQIKHDIGNMRFKHGIYIRNSWVISQGGDVRLSILKKLTDDLIMYSPVEEAKLPERWFEGYGTLYDRLWTMTKWGKDIIESHGYKADVLYHYFDKDLKINSNVEPLSDFLTIAYSIDWRKNLGMIYGIADSFRDNRFVISGKSYYYVLHDYAELYPNADVKYYWEVVHKDDSITLPDSEIKALYQQSNFYINPSYKEGFDMTALEALCNGLITFLPDDELHRELFYDFPNAVFVKTTRTFASYNQLENIVLLDDWIDAISKNINRTRMGFRVPERFKEETIKKQMFELLDKVK